MRIGSTGRQLPSPGAVIGIVALVAALAGTAIALPGRNTVNSGDIKNGQVKTRDLGSNAATGAKVRESSLGTVPSARNAQTVAGNDVRSFSFQVPQNQATETFEFGGVRLSGDCLNGNPNPDLANISGQGAQVVAEGAVLDPETHVAQRTTTLLSTDSFSLDDDADDDGGRSTAQVLFADGTATTLEVAWSNDPIGPPPTVACDYWGHVTSG